MGPNVIVEYSGTSSSVQALSPRCRSEASSTRAGTCLLDSCDCSTPLARHASLLAAISYCQRQRAPLPVLPSHVYELAVSALPRPADAIPRPLSQLVVAYVVTASSWRGAAGPQTSRATLPKTLPLLRYGQFESRVPRKSDRPSSSESCRSMRPTKSCKFSHGI